LEIRRGAGLPDVGNEVKLVVKGQGIVQFALKSIKMFTVEISGDKSAIRLKIDTNGAKFSVLRNQVWTQAEKTSTFEKAGAGLDQDQECKYWYSLDSHNRTIYYGKGEMRKSTVLASYQYADDPLIPDDEWVNHVLAVRLDSRIAAAETVWRDPVVEEPALVVLPTDEITMDQVASYTATVSANLTRECQQMYSNVSGKNFQLNTLEFPHFVDAIEESIHSKNGWCYKKLAEKMGELGNSPEETYLRITMGRNQGDSPGIPYVIEIWPAQHYSPIHNHAGSNAIIRVLHGTIEVNLYSMLSQYHMEPIACRKFVEGEVTWISPLLNQTHQLKNSNPAGGTSCITVQCYMYADDNTMHYDYFDYLDKSKRGKVKTKRFTPNVDMSFLPFKELMKKEWDAAHPAPTGM
jgi:hypothetical protein